MDRTDAAAVLDELMAGYPWSDMDQLARLNWVEAIEDSGADPGRGKEIARRWSRTHEKFPSLAEFLAVITPHVYIQPPDDPDELRVSPALAHKLSRAWRDALAAVDEKIAQAGAHRGVAGHWHGGPDPCPLCGGQPRIGH